MWQLQEAWEYVEAYLICATDKMSSGSPMGLLQPLSISSRELADTSMDLFMAPGLPRKHHSPHRGGQIL